jgi:hypothetical protein
MLLDFMCFIKYDPIVERNLSYLSEIEIYFSINNYHSGGALKWGNHGRFSILARKIA